MKKKIVYAGLLFLLIAVVLVFVSGSLLKPLLSNLAALNNVTIGNNGFYYSAINLTNTTRLFLLMKSNSSVNTYLLNSSAFARWYAYMANGTGRGGLPEALSLEGRGAVAIYSNSSYVFLGPASNSSTPVYASNSALVPGEYYAVVDNSNGSASHLKRVYVALALPTASFISSNSLSAYKNSLAPEEFAGLFIIILFALALLFIIYGIISKQRPKVPGGGAKDEVSKEEIDALYRNVK